MMYREKTMERRTFLVGSAMALPMMGANDKVNVAVVGVGGRGSAHVREYLTIPGARVAALCDVNTAATERNEQVVLKGQGAKPKVYQDLRKLYEDKEIDAVSIATPNHWHALATIWACQAGKDVYVEKPACHNIFEGRQMVTAARKYNRMVQVGSQSRSAAHVMRAIELLQEGAIGQIYHARGLCFRRRFSIGHTPDMRVPAGLDWDHFLGPAQWKPYSKNKFAYNWHWFWDTGNGDIGNQGVHEMDIALWGLGRTGWPVSVSSSGGKFVWKDDQETPNTQNTTFDFGDAQMSFDVRNLPTPPEGLGGMRSPNYVGNIFFGDQGFLIVDHSGLELYKSTAGSISGDAARGASAGNQEKYEKVMQQKALNEDTTPHMMNFFEAVRKRDYKLLHAEIEI